ncbi:MAG: hypothetical protein FJ304_05450 [Planctomycetes bacterium]|nr:hypothetical protein [Planctomycetota bacterium]
MAKPGATTVVVRPGELAEALGLPRDDRYAISAAPLRFPQPREHFAAMDRHSTLPGLASVWNELAASIYRGLFTKEEAAALVKHKDARKALLLANPKA